ncbi:hypothetical protein [Tsukamurella soli]
MSQPPRPAAGYRPSYGPGRGGAGQPQTPPVFRTPEAPGTFRGTREAAAPGTFRGTPGPGTVGPGVPGPGMRAPSYPGGAPAGNATVVLSLENWPLRWWLYLVGPTVTIDGRVVAEGWGRSSIPVSAGPHRIAVACGGGVRRGIWSTRAELDFSAAPGQVVPVFYRAGTSRLWNARIGHESRMYPGVIGDAVIFVVSLLVALAIVGVAVLHAAG